MPSKKLNKVEYFVFALVAISLIAGVFIFLVYGEETFESRYVVEDGIVEYGTALFLLAIGVYQLIKAAGYKVNSRTLAWLTGTVFMGLLFIFGAGEEVSWGQRLLGFETPESLKEINRQDEVTLHNIRIGDFDVNKLIFSKLLTITLVIYFLVVPFLYKRWTFVTGLFDSFGIPVPRSQHIIVFLTATVIALLIPSGKKWELHELTFAAVFFIIFINPFNKDKIG